MDSGMDEPVQDNLDSRQGDPQGGAQGHDDDGYMLTIRFKERPLIWIAIAVLALFVVIEGLALLTMDSGSNSQFPQPGEFQDPNDIGRSGSGSQSYPSQGGSDSSSSGLQGSDTTAPPITKASQGTSPGVPAMEIITGDEAVTRVNAYLKGAGLSKTDADGLLNVINSMNTGLVALDARLAKGEIALDAYTSSIQTEQENARLGILRILGWQKSTVLLDSLSGSVPGR